MKNLIVILLSVVILSLGISQIRVSISQTQNNDQEQKSIQNQITSVNSFVINNDKLDNVIWTNFIEYSSSRSFINFIDTLEDYQKNLMKIAASSYVCMVWYPVIVNKNIFTNSSEVSNVSETSNTNEMDIQMSFFEKLRSLF